ncbi:hypothetical protein FGG08_006818 [Glutinoglossum americanum]|uniref:Uncharacterized protein n=1 Tax=Glutinoglossum americanum TaxID=1670608 RepID=A0A9P8I2N2_9PEZI|nr:hypothetical protein FGG08_006818 [Glutinoglossum americanum]
MYCSASSGTLIGDVTPARIDSDHSASSGTLIGDVTPARDRSTSSGALSSSTLAGDATPPPVDSEALTDESLSHLQGSFADFDFGFNDPPVMLSSPFDGEQTNQREQPVSISPANTDIQPPARKRKESECIAVAVPMGSPEHKKRKIASISPVLGGEFEGTPETAIRSIPASRLSAEEIEQGRLEFEAKFPEVIQATRQMNAALGLRNYKPFPLPFRIPDWFGEPNVLIDNLEYYRSIQYGDTLYLNSISFSDLTPDEENGFRANKLLCKFEAQEMVSLRASFVDLTAFGGGKWTYLVLGFKGGKDRNGTQRLMTIACPVAMVQVVGYSGEKWVDRYGYPRRNVRVDMNYTRGGVPIISSENADYKLWGKVVESMSGGCCRVSYLVEDWCWDPNNLCQLE